jgi:hypothetical protein
MAALHTNFNQITSVKAQPKEKTDPGSPDNVKHKTDKPKRVKLSRLQNILLHTIKDSSCYKSKAWQKHKLTSVFC